MKNITFFSVLLSMSYLPDSFQESSEENKAREPN